MTIPKKHLEDVAKWARNGLGFLLVVGFVWIASAAYSSLGNVSGWATLTASLWNQMSTDLDDLNGRVNALSNVPSWAVIAFNLTNCPSWWTEADGASGRPNLRGQFVRWWNSTAAGLDAGRWFGTSQNGSLVMNDIPQTQRVFSLVWTSLFYDAPRLNPSANYGWTNYSPWTNITGNWWLWTVDANYVWATRPTNVALLYCVKN